MSQILLDMIENCHFNDCRKMDEINARIYCLKSNRSNNQFVKLTDHGFIVRAPDGYEYEIKANGLAEQNTNYMQSLDAADSLLPDNWVITCLQRRNFDGTPGIKLWVQKINKIPRQIIESPWLETETAARTYLAVNAIMINKESET